MSIRPWLWQSPQVVDEGGLAGVSHSTTAAVARDQDGLETFFDRNRARTNAGRLLAPQTVAKSLCEMRGWTEGRTTSDCLASKGLPVTFCQLPHTLTVERGGKLGAGGSSVAYTAEHKTYAMGKSGQPESSQQVVIKVRITKCSAIPYARELLVLNEIKKQLGKKKIEFLQGQGISFAEVHPLHPLDMPGLDKFPYLLVKPFPSTSMSSAYLCMNLYDLERFCARLCRLVDEAHRQSLVILDLKPANVLISIKDDQALQVCDLGGSYFWDAQRQGKFTEEMDAALTRAQDYFSWPCSRGKRLREVTQAVREGGAQKRQAFNSGDLRKGQATQGLQYTRAPGCSGTASYRAPEMRDPAKAQGYDLPSQSDMFSVGLLLLRIMCRSLQPFAVAFREDLCNGGSSQQHAREDAREAARRYEAFQFKSLQILMSSDENRQDLRNALCLLFNQDLKTAPAHCLLHPDHVVFDILEGTLRTIPLDRLTSADCVAKLRQELGCLQVFLCTEAVPRDNLRINRLVPGRWVPCYEGSKATLNVEVRWLGEQMGYGVFAAEDIGPNSYCCVYSGEVRVFSAGWFAGDLSSALLRAAGGLSASAG